MSAVRWMRSLGALLAAFAVLPAAAWAQSSASAYTYATRYDGERRVTGTIAPDPDGSGPIHYAAVRNTYDTAGRLVRQEKGELAAWQSESVAPADWGMYTTFSVFSQVDTTYDAVDRKLSETVSSGGTAYELTQYSYDAMGRLECTAVRMNPAVYGSLPSSACTLGTTGSQGPDRITKNVYDAAGQVLTVQKAYGTSLQQDYATFRYSLNGKQTALIDADGAVAKISYDGVDRQAAWYFPDKVSVGATSTTDYEAYGYDPNGNRLSLRKRDGSVINYSYDALNRVTMKDIPGGTSADVYYGYDLEGKQLYARFGSASGSGLTQTYDGFGRELSASSNLDGTARTLSYQYDADGDRTRVTHPDGKYFDYAYDGLDRMLSSNWYAPAVGSVRYLTIVYDAQGRRSSTNRASSWTYYGYDAVSRLASAQHSFASGTSNSTTTFAYNPASQIVTQSRDNDAYAFTGYTTASTSYAANGLNQYASVGGTALTYDANGNLTSNGGTSYAYDVENRLISATGTQSASLVYDPAGRLWQISDGTSTHRFLYDGDALVAEYDGSGTMLHRYAYGPGVDEPVLWDTGSALDCSQTRFLHPDHQGSIVALADCNGNPIALDSYDEYGVPGSGNIGRFQYTGQAWLPELGLYYYKARIYWPGGGRFLQTDPVGYADQNNLYAYVGNDPVNNGDLSGTCTGSLISGAGGECAGGGFVNGIGGSIFPNGAPESNAANNSPPGSGGPAPGIGHNGGPPLEGAAAEGAEAAAGRGLVAILGRVGGALTLLFSASPTASNDMLPPKISPTDLNPSQLRNLTRFEKSVSGSTGTHIYQLPNGSVQFSGRVNGNVPGSYATYVKVVDSAGRTQTFYKETIGPSGEFIHRKVKFP